MICIYFWKKKRNFCRWKNISNLPCFVFVFLHLFYFWIIVSLHLYIFVFCVSKDWICSRRRSSPSCAKWTIFKSSYSRSRGNSNAGSLSLQVLNQKKSPILYLYPKSACELTFQDCWQLCVQDLCKFNLVRANIQFAWNKQWELCKQGYQVAAINSMRWIISG